jgi:hypothetical protein
MGSGRNKRFEDSLLGRLEIAQTVSPTKRQPAETSCAPTCLLIRV